jgi:F0F1-type ATP synthase assembly protein I
VTKTPEPAPTVAAPRVQAAPAGKPVPAGKPGPAANQAATAKPAPEAKPQAEAKAVPNGTPAPAGTGMLVKTPKKPETAPENKAAEQSGTKQSGARQSGTQQEPGLLSGSTLAGDLMRQSRDADAAKAGEDTELIAAATDEAPEAETEQADTPRRSRKEAKAEAARAAKAAKDVDGAEQESSAAREWAVLAGQGVIAVIAGALLFKGFEKLWDVFPWVALILALLVIVGLVAMVRILRRTDDITSFVIAVVVGMIVTLGPLAFMLASG